MFQDTLQNTLNDSLINVLAPDFSPSDIPGMQFLFDGSDSTDTSKIIASGGAISDWFDQSGMNNNVSQSTGAFKPTISLASQNNLDGVSFSTDQRFSFAVGTDFSQYKDQDFFIVCNTDDTGALKTMFSQWDLGGGQAAYRYSFPTLEGFQITTNNDTDAVISIGTDSGLTSTVIANAYITESEMGATYNDNAFSTIATSEAMTNSTQKPLLGRRSTGGNNYFGIMYEVILYNRKLNDADRGAVLAYLNTKWGVF